MASIKNQLIPLKPFNSKNLNKSKGILDDFAVRKAVATREGSITKTPSADIDITNKKYVDDNFVELSGDTMTGDLSFSAGKGLVVGSNSYAFKYSEDHDAGLFFNSTSGVIEVRTITGDYNVYFGAGTLGQSYFAGAVGIGTETITGAFEVRGGVARFGDGTNYVQLGAAGDISFGGTGDLLIRGDHYAFRWIGDEDVGLYFDETNTRFSFTDDSGVAQQWFKINGDTYLAGQTGIGTETPAASAILDLTSTTKSLLLTRMTTVQRDALTGVNGMILYNTTLNKVQVYEGGAWASVI